MSDKIVVGLDIGTTKVCAVVATSDELDRVQVLGVGVAESEGLNRGVVVNIDKTVAAVREAIEEAERMAGVTVRNVIVGIAGDHVQSFQSRGVITISGRDGEITEGDVQRLLEDTTHVAMPADREILHVISNTDKKRRLILLCPGLLDQAVIITATISDPGPRPVKCSKRGRA